MAAGLIQGGEVVALTKRGITEETCRKFGYQVAELSGKKVQVAPYFDADGVMVAQKARFAGKEFTTFGAFKNVQLFGQQLWGAGGKKVVVTEGEIDCMSVSQLQGNKWPVVSIPNGAQGAKRSLSKALDWLCTFEEVILMFDMDEPGIAASKECAQLFPPGKCKIASLPLKDPNECLQSGKGDAVISAIWQAKPFRPDGVVKLSDLRDAVLKEVEDGLPWFSEKLTKATYGRRWGELYAFGAGTGIGKTDFLTQQIEYDVNVLDQKVGLFMLEQNPVETAKRVAGKFAKKTFHVPDGSWQPEELAAAFDKLAENDKVFLYDNFGATDYEVIASTIRFLAHSEGVRIFYLDHLTALAAAADDEKKALEQIMASIASLAKELNVIIHIVSHLATPEGKPHEEGGRVMIRHFKGSRAIGFWCHFMFGLERDQQHENPAWRSITIFRVLKDRYTGRGTGQTVFFGYDADIGMLFETEEPDKAAAFSDETVDDDCPF